LEKENARALQKGILRRFVLLKPILISIDAAVSYMMEHLDYMSVFAGTHNEESTYFLMDLMKKKIKTNDDRIWFGQLYGMSDNISYNLANHEYNVAKYLPL
jgi:proline dehydrogenase